MNRTIGYHRRVIVALGSALLAVAAVAVGTAAGAHLHTTGLVAGIAASAETPPLADGPPWG